MSRMIFFPGLNPKLKLKSTLTFGSRLLAVVIVLTTSSGCSMLNTVNPLHLLESDEDDSDENAVRDDDGPAVRQPAEAQRPVLDPVTGKRRKRFPSYRYYSVNPDPRIQRGLEAEMLVLGMRIEDVQAVWGKPQQIETAGDPLHGNQKWSYIDSVLHQFNPRPVRVIYFERGQVVGWENANR